MKTNKTAAVIIAFLNILGIICLVYFLIPYITHNTTVNNPNAMLPAEAWDAAGMALTIGLIPLAIANTLGFLFTVPQKKLLRLLWFKPSLVCLVIVISYFVLSF